MDVGNLINTVQGSLGNKLPGIAGALVILVIGWLIAVIVRAVLRRGLGAAGLNRRTNSGMDLESLIAKIVFWVIMAFVLLAFFNALDLQAVSKPLDALLSSIMAFLPKLISGAILGIVAFVIAKVVKSLVSNGLAKTSLDEKLAGEAGLDAGGSSMSSNLANIAFWLIILLFLPMVLGVLELKGLLGPVQQMFDKMLAALPNIIGAAIIGFVGYFVAKILREIVTNLLSASGADRMALKAGMGDNMRISKLVGMVVFIFVLVPAVIAALEKLNIEVISGPATEMLGQFMAAIPNIIAAAIILAVTYFVAKFICGFLVSLLQGIGFDDYPAKMGFANLASGTSLSAVVGKVIMFFAMLFGSVEAANRLGFTQVRDVVTMFIEFGGQILLGAVILGVGFWMANLVHKMVAQVSGAGAANIARFAVMGLVVAMGLRAMGLADDIVNMAFGLTLGAIAVAVALSFGLGGREAAGRKMGEWLNKM